MARYSFKDYTAKSMARSYGRSIPISFKQSVKVCNLIRNKKLQYAKQMLKNIIGKNPNKTSMELLKLLEDVESNAQFKGLNANILVINFLSAKNTPKAWHYGRRRRRLMKRTDIELVVSEG